MWVCTTKSGSGGRWRWYVRCVAMASGGKHVFVLPQEQAALALVVLVRHALSPYCFACKSVMEGLSTQQRTASTANLCNWLTVYCMSLHC